MLAASVLTCDWPWCQHQARAGGPGWRSLGAQHLGRADPRRLAPPPEGDGVCCQDHHWHDNRTSRAGVMAWAGTPRTPPNIAQLRRPAAIPSGSPAASATAASVLTCQAVIELTWYRCSRSAQHREIPSAAPAGYHDELRKDGQPESGQHCAEHLRRGVNAGVVDDPVGLLAGGR